MSYSGLLACIGVCAGDCLNRQRGSTHNPRRFCDLRPDNRDLPTQQVSGAAVNFALNRIKKKIASPGDLSAQDDDLGIDYVYQARDSASQNQRGALNNDPGNFITLSGALKDVGATGRRAHALKLRLDPTMDGCKRFSLDGAG